MEHTVNFVKKTGKVTTEKSYAFGSAIFAGGTARAAAIQTIVPAALARVGNGRYREAYEVIESAIPTLTKRALRGFVETTFIAWANADSFAAFIWAVVAAEGRNKSPLSAKSKLVWDTLVIPLTGIPAIESRKPVTEVKPKAAPRPQFTKAQLLAMLAALEEGSEEEGSEEEDSEEEDSED